MAIGVELSGDLQLNQLLQPVAQQLGDQLAGVVAIKIAARIRFGLCSSG
jgi:hypothetical protein